MKDITLPNLWSWSNDLDDIQNLLLDIINGKTTIEHTRKIIRSNIK